MFEYMAWLDAEKTTIQAKRADGSIRIIDSATIDLFGIAKAGKLGAIAAYVPPREPTDAELLAVERADMRCSPLQGILALGETEWGKVLAYRETATWGEKAIIDHAGLWRRNSENIAFFGRLLQYTPTQIDALFRAAMQIEA